MSVSQASTNGEDSTSAFHSRSEYRLSQPSVLGTGHAKRLLVCSASRLVSRTFSFTPFLCGLSAALTQGRWIHRPLLTAKPSLGFRPARLAG